MDPFLWNILKFITKIKQFGEHLIRGKDFWLKKTTCPHAFLECFKNIKGLLKHAEFSLKFCSCNFESIRIHSKNKTIFLIYSVRMVIFQIFKKQFLRTIHTLLGSFFPTFTLNKCLKPNHVMHEFMDDIIDVQITWYIHDPNYFWCDQTSACTNDARLSCCHAKHGRQNLHMICMMPNTIKGEARKGVDTELKWSPPIFEKIIMRKTTIIFIVSLFFSNKFHDLQSCKQKIPIQTHHMCYKNPPSELELNHVCNEFEESR